MALIQDDVLAFLRDEFGVDTSDVDERTPLFSSGVVDSFALVALITFIEAPYGLRMSRLDVNLDNLDGVKRILAFVERAASA